MKKKIILALSLVLFLLHTAYAQRLSVSGTVTEANGGPLPGVNVLEQGTTNGVQTDFDGNYTINVSTGSTLVFSYLGMKTQTVVVGSSTTVNLSMEEDSSQLDEVVVTALGIKRETRALGYAAQEVKGEEFTEARETNIANSLAGKVAGVQVTNIATGAGGSSRVVIRGNSSISGNDAPLYVIDGVPIDNQNLDPADYAGGGVDYGDGISGINPDDVESMTVLKGPNAAALYGARAANGVILITTKSGSSRKGLGISLNSNVTMDEVATVPTFQNRFGIGYDYTSFNGGGSTIIDGVEYEVILPNEGSTIMSWGPLLEGQLVADWADPTKVMSMIPYPDNVRNFFQTGYTATNTIALNGGNDKANMRLSISDLKNEGNIPGSTFNRQTVNFRGMAKITDQLSIDAKVNYIHHKGSQRPGVSASSSNIMSALIQLPRHVDMEKARNYKDENGNPLFYTTRFENPYWTINEIRNEDERDRIIGLVSLRYDMTDWLSVQGRTGIDFYTDERFNRSAIGSRSARTGLVSNYTWHVKERNSDILLLSKKDFSNSFSGSLTLGASQLVSSREVTGAKGTNLRAPGLYHISNANEVTPRYEKVERQMNSVFAAGQIAYKNYLFLDGTARNDWSSVLGRNNYSFFYPSVATSFVFTDAFGLKSKALTFGKLRAGYSEVGNDSNPYLTTTGYTSSTQTINGQGMAQIQNRIPNPDLKNELTQAVEFGADIRLFNNRIGVDVTYYNSSTNNQILPVNISDATGFGTMVINAGEITNEGIELLINTTPIKISNSFKWDLIFNYAKNKSKVVSLVDGIEAHQMGQDRWGTIEARPGEDFGNIVSFAYKRNEKGEKLLDNFGRYQRDGTEVKVLGNIQPDWVGGLTNRFSYKGFTLNTLIDIKMGGELLSGTKYIQAARGTGVFTDQNLFQNSEGEWVGIADGVMENDYYIDDGNGNQVLHLSAGEKSDIELSRLDLTGRWTRNDILEEFVLDASYISLREVSLAYDFPKSLLKKSVFSSAKISLVGRNLWYIEEHMQGIGITPEAAFSSQSSTQGSESYTLPSTRSFGVNLNLGF
ncbi:SusC/RagA family TonB-linked outer membrane protein [Arenibacter sp. M-2]|uniref:SusC/RagA family TonB-linked outer membrane protein n=1 Tax=Arenibacter sp. M-2 TaxID=3053612 RepID=UPI0025713047|nr:SusC/RagA family TonB-linked outer membrane protein [Arenibacter sp. M-2]MDL5512528.1 SusC/RagA family TonB-linked outer membrane protein [Arenibacter sp. M-2]